MISLFDFGLQMVGMSIYGLLVVAFYTFLGLFVGSRIAVIVVTSIYSFTVRKFMISSFRYHNSCG